MRMRESDLFFPSFKVSVVCNYDYLRHKSIYNIDSISWFFQNLMNREFFFRFFGVEIFWLKREEFFDLEKLWEIKVPSRENDKKWNNEAYLDSSIVCWLIGWPVILVTWSMWSSRTVIFNIARISTGTFISILDLLIILFLSAKFEIRFLLFGKQFFFFFLSSTIFFFFFLSSFFFDFCIDLERLSVKRIRAIIEYNMQERRRGKCRIEPNRQKSIPNNIVEAWRRCRFRCPSILYNKPV